MALKCCWLLTALAAIAAIAPTTAQGSDEGGSADGAASPSPIDKEAGHTTNVSLDSATGDGSQGASGEAPASDGEASASPSPHGSPTPAAGTPAPHTAPGPAPTPGQAARQAQTPSQVPTPSATSSIESATTQPAGAATAEPHFVLKTEGAFYREFPFPKDFRDPNVAWGLEAKLIFVLLYACFWVSVVWAVHFWADVEDRVLKAKEKLLELLGRGKGDRKVDDGEDELLLVGDDVPGDLNIGPKPSYPHHKRVHEFFHEQVEDTPTSVALVVPAYVDAGKAVPRRTVRYRELKASVDELARALIALGLCRGQLAAISLERSCAQVVAIYATLTTGGGYLPIDASAPRARKKCVISDSDAISLVAEEGDDACAELVEELNLPLVSLAPSGSQGAFQIIPASLSGQEADWERVRSVEDPSGQQLKVDRPEAGDLAMLIYTSGTTGTPKGIIYDHAHLLHGSHFWAEEHSVTAESVLLLKSPYFWAVIEWEMFPSLIRGGSLVVASREGHKNPEYLTHVVAKEKVTVLMLTPSVLDLVLDVHQVQATLKPLQGLEHITTVGEPLPSALANRTVTMPNLKATLRNFYGASESCCTVYKVPAKGVPLKLFPNKAPAGLPQQHAEVYIMAVDEVPLRQTKLGEAGEICFGGVLAAGYYKLEELTNHKFVHTNEFGRLYKSGDLGRWRGGVLEVIGRTDRQVKVNGVRIEPEEVEAVLKKLQMEQSSAKTRDSDLESGPIGRSVSPSADDKMAVGVVKLAAVVTTPEPAELVAFVVLRDGVRGLGDTELRAHCKANLSPAYVPKHYVVLQPWEMPLLPNGKPNLSELKTMATDRVEALQEEEEEHMDSLGRMRKVSQWALFENAVIHRCYAFWMMGVLIDHYARCGMDFVPSDPERRLLPFCTTVSSSHVRPWSEALIRTLGNDQDLFGFIMLGAYQDSRPEKLGAKAQVNMGWKDLYVFTVYMLMALPFPQICALMSGDWAWPDKTYSSYLWEAEGPPGTRWGWSYMKKAGSTSGHRWYLLMVLEGRLFIHICEKLLCIPDWAQVLIMFVPSVWGVGRFESAFDMCTSGSPLPVPVQYALTWIFGPHGGCALWERWVHWYIMFYVVCFHYLRPCVRFSTRRLPKGPAWGAAATGASMTLGVLMALFHYPNVILETGTDASWAWLELSVSTLQPALFALGTAYWPVNASWWGNTTLGCYLAHFYIRDRMTELFEWFARSCSWDNTGLILPLLMVGVCFAFASTIGPIGHSIMIAPQLLLNTAVRTRTLRNVPPPPVAPTKSPSTSRDVATISATLPVKVAPTGEAKARGTRGGGDFD